MLLGSVSRAKGRPSVMPRPSSEAVPPLIGVGPFRGMAEPGPAETCEHCGSPLDERGTCWSCAGGGFQSGSSPVGAAPLEKSELSRVLRRSVGRRAHGAYSLSLQQAEGMAHLREQIESMVEQFNASPQTKNSVKMSSERNAVKLLPHLGPTKAAIASVAQEFLSLGRSVGEASLYISKVHPRVGRLSSLVIEVYVPDGGTVEVLVNGRRREFKSQSEGLYRRLRIPVYCWDEGAVLELSNAVLCAGRYPAKRMRVVGPRSSCSSFRRGPSSSSRSSRRRSSRGRSRRASSWSTPSTSSGNTRSPSSPSRRGSSVRRATSTP